MQISDERLLELIYNASLSYVVTEELNQEQLEKLDNITYKWCSCERCKTSSEVNRKTIDFELNGHANPIQLEIYLSKEWFRQMTDRTVVAVALIELIATSLHEIVHILFPQFDEKQTIHKTWEWLKKNNWAMEFEKGNH